MKIIRIAIKTLFVIAAIVSIITNVAILQDKKEINTSAKTIQEDKDFNKLPPNVQVLVNDIEAVSGATVDISIGKWGD